MEVSEDAYLCQVSETVSCGACCGLYNIADLSQDSLETLLVDRTEKFAHTPRTIEGIDDFQEKMESWTPPDRPFPQFHHCPFIGLIGFDKKRVGCLLHPVAPGNNGQDFRGLSYYGGFACRTYFCPTVRQMSPTYLCILKQVMDHWYLYGLIVTEYYLLVAFFNEIENRIERPVIPSDFSVASEAAELFHEFAGLKISWPYQREDAPGPCNYFFEDREYPKQPVKLSGEAMPPSVYEDIFRELNTSFTSKDEYEAATSLLNRLFDRLEAAITRIDNQRN